MVDFLFQSELKCRFIGSCQITIESRRQCSHCRLKKCFEVKMRKEWIRTEAECHYRRLKRLSKQHKPMNSINQNRKSPSDKYPVG